MATATYVLRTAESETAVTYRYGTSREDQPHELTIDKASGRTTGSTDRAGWVGGWIRRQHARTGTWVERASIAT